MQCRICFEEDGDLIVPCRCRGTSSYIHRSCLDQYIRYYPDRICRVCNTEFDYDSPEEVGFCLFMFVVMTGMLAMSKAFVIVKFCLLATVGLLSLYFLHRRLIGTTPLAFLGILVMLFFPGGHRDAIHMYLIILGTIAFVYTLSRQMSAIMLLGLVVTTMVALYCAFFLFLAYHALDPPAFAVLVCVYFMAWYGWINTHTRLRLA